MIATLSLSLLGLLTWPASGAPSGPDLSKIKFYLWTRQNPSEHDTIELTAESLAASHFQPSHPVIILAHGWNSHGRITEKGFGADFADDYLAVGEYNVFSIDWGDLETWANYPQAAARTRPVGEHAAGLVALLAQHTGAGLANIHVIGHSLGAHVAGFLAKRVQGELGLGLLPRLTGLDPAQPLFELAGPGGRVDKSDAEFVEIVHTNSGVLWHGCLSIKEAIGHVDFYPAGGEHQPGCAEACIGSNCMNITIEDLIKGGCSHNRAPLYYAESVRAVAAAQFEGRLCDSWEEFQAGDCCSAPTAVMGEWTPVTAHHGMYFLDVREEQPYALGGMGNGGCKKN